MSEEEQSIQKRQTAYKVRIYDIVNSEYITQEGWQPNYLDINGRKVARINVMGVVVLKAGDDNITIDDGTGKISLRVFENNKVLEKVAVGDIVLCIGKPREFNSEKYILPEIVRKIHDSKWLELRKKELSQEAGQEQETEQRKEESEKRGEQEKVKDKESVEEDKFDKVLKTIKGLDSGEGVTAEEIISESGQEETEQTLHLLLEKGEIFEIKPGKYKVLE